MTASFVTEIVICPNSLANTTTRYFYWCQIGSKLVRLLACRTVIFRSVSVRKPLFHARKASQYNFTSVNGGNITCRLTKGTSNCRVVLRALTRVNWLYVRKIK